MTPFDFRTTPAIASGPGKTAALGEQFRALGATRVALISDPGVIGAGLTAEAEASLATAGLGVFRWQDVKADPPEDDILAATAAARAEGCDAVLGLGGGSPMDTAKLVALLLGTDQPLAEAYGVGHARGRRVPLILVPTTAGTGSEVTPIAIVTTGENEKKGVVAPQLLPDAAVLDATLTTGLPATVTAATGIDAMVHAIEAYTSRHRKNPLSDVLAREALALLGANIRQAVAVPGDVDARGAMLLGACLAGMAFANAPVAAVHALAYPLGGHFKVPHGLSNAMVLPHVLAFNRADPTAEAAYAELAPAVFPSLGGHDTGLRVDAFIEELAALGPELGLDVTLASAGVSHNHLPMLAEDAMKQQRLLVNNPREMTAEAALEIYTRAL
ncbi:MAG: iron-containing alcohol dehydrogenase [Pseudomonadota bacterium]